MQLREKRAREELLSSAEELRGICARKGALLTVNDDIELSGAARVYLGEEYELPAREILGPDAVEEARRAVQEGADYLGVGTVFATPTKADADVKGLALVEEIVWESLPLPWFAIGGITLETATAGAPGFAVVRAIFDAEDLEAACQLRSFLSK